MNAVRIRTPDSSIAPTPFHSLAALEAANRSIGQNYFSPETMRWWHSRLVGTLMDGRYFVTSERMGWDRPRRYSIRMANPDGSVETIAFHAYGTGRQAVAAARRLIALGY